MEIVVKRAGQCLVATDEFQQGQIDSLVLNKEIVIKTKSSRNPQNLRRFFKFITVALDTQDHYQSIESLRFALLIKSGYCTSIVSHKDGSVTFMPKSLAFDKMEEDEFREVFKHVINHFHIMLQEQKINYTEEELYRLMDFE